MVKGLDKFKEHFSSFANNYVLIGGTACWIAMQKAGLHFRVTKDLDIVLLCIEALDNEFVKSFWKFIKMGGYQYQQKSTGKKQFYRFHSPENVTFPEMLELFSRRSDSIPLPKNNRLTPIPVDEEISSLSAILLDEEYYSFIYEGKHEIEDLPVLIPEHLIPLKAKAYLNLTDLLNSGIAVDEKDIRKHKNDIIRLYQLLTINTHIVLPETIKKDLRKFLIELKKNPPDLKTLGLRRVNFKDIMTNLTQIYNISLD